MTTIVEERNKTQDLVYVSIFAVLIAVCSWISIPVAVPFTLQTMGVFTAVGILGGRRGSMAVLIYRLLGIIGIPVFAGFTGGIGVLAGTTGGYIVGFLVSALVMWGMEKFFGRGKAALFFSMLAGLLACYTVGTLWFLVVYTSQTGPVGIGAVLGWCVIPFIIPDLLKILLAMVLTKRLGGVIRR